MKGLHKVLNETIEKAVWRISRAKTKQEIKQVWEELNTLLNKEDYKDRTRINVASRVRKGVSMQLNINKHKIHATRLRWTKEVVKEEELFERVKREDKKSFAKRRNDLENNIVYNFAQMVGKAIQLINTYSHIDITIGLALLTGRRTVEILKTGDIEYVDQGHVRFYGQAKKKGKARPYVIPVLFDAKEIVKAWKLLRKVKDYSNISNVQVHQVASSGLNLKVKKEFADFTPKKLVMHDLRKIYATYCTDKIRGNDKYIKEYNRRYFLAQLLGHTSDELDDNVKASERYEDFTIVYDN